MASTATPQHVSTGRRLTRLLLIGLMFAGLLWFTWFDSYSLVRRAKWQRDYEQLVEENIQLRSEIAELQSMLENPPSDEAIEKIAREQYGMRRDGETVYRTEE